MGCEQMFIHYILYPIKLPTNAANIDYYANCLSQMGWNRLHVYEYLFVVLIIPWDCTLLVSYSCFFNQTAALLWWETVVTDAFYKKNVY